VSGKDVLIQVRDLEKHFDGGSIRALNGVSADIRRGEVVVVIGPSGSGKSTFLRCLNLLERPTGGAVVFDGVDITDPKVNIVTNFFIWITPFLVLRRYLFQRIFRLFRV